jgi:hypothetical protein
MSQLNQATDAETADSRWSWLYRVAGVAALISVVIILLEVTGNVVLLAPELL